MRAIAVAKSFQPFANAAGKSGPASPMVAATDSSIARTFDSSSASQS